MTSLYIHIPFCEKKCFYCSFVVSVGQKHRMDEYLDCLELESKKFSGEKIETIYWGGGTPSLLNIEQIGRLMKILHKAFDTSAVREITIEANPESIDLDKAKVLKSLGFSRVSLGIQTFQDQTLKYLGRCHDRKKAFEAFQLLRKAGHDNVNVDFMYAFPNQTEKEINQDLEEMAALKSEHVSLYTLTIEQNSRFFVQKVCPPSDSAQADYYEMVALFLEKAGYLQYEVSNFAKEGFQSLHNINYWQGGNYIGLGVGAHSHGRGKRSWNVSRFKDYLSKVKAGQDPMEGYEILAKDKRMKEKILFGLRMNQGVDLKQIESEFQTSFGKDFLLKIEDLLQAGFLYRENGSTKVTSRGRLVLDELCQRLI